MAASRSVAAALCRITELRPAAAAARARRPTGTEYTGGVTPLRSECGTGQAGGGDRAGRGAAGGPRAATAVAARDRDAELAALRERVGRLERFKRHLAVVYAAIALAAGTAWGVLVDCVKGEFFAAKP